jgi:hypothetical protein
MVNVRPAVDQHSETVMAIEDSSVRANFQRARSTGRKRQDQIVRREAPKHLELNAIQRGIRMQKLQVRFSRCIHATIVVRPL